MCTENLGILNELEPVFRPYVQNVYEELKLGKKVKNSISLATTCLFIYVFFLYRSMQK